MREITRIHIAKVAYDIELGAKKDLQTYIAELERFASDEEILGDIEIRITELLAERGVVAGGVITKDDVMAIRGQLGEPSDFAPEEAEATPELHDAPRRVYRDIDSAVLGGVLSGLGRYVGVDPLWVRLVFIVLLLASFGTAMVVYLILWLIIPPARTAAEKLRMNGQPVTLTSIKAFGEKAEPAISKTATAVRQVLRIGVGMVLTLGALAAIAAVTVVASMIFFGAPAGPSLAGMSPEEAGWFIAVFALFATAGLLLSALLALLASATLRRVWNKRLAAAVVVIIAAGLIAFAGGVGAILYGQFALQARLESSRLTTSAALPADFATVKKVSVVGEDNNSRPENIAVAVTYIVSDKLRYEFEAPTGMKPEITVSEDSLSATVEIKKTAEIKGVWGYLAGVELRIYGPALDHIEAAEGVQSVRYEAARPQPALSGRVRGTTSLTLRGAYDAVTVANEAGGVIDLTEAAIKSLAVDNKGGLVTAGVVRSLAVTEPDVCPAASVPDEPNSMVRVQAVSSGKMTYNGIEQPASTTGNSCGKVVIGTEDDMEEGL